MVYAPSSVSAPGKYIPATLGILLNPIVADGWIGVDLDGTLAYYDGFKGLDHIGDPITSMVERVRFFIARGLEVRILTARADLLHSPEELALSKATIEAWCLKHIGRVLPITCSKDRYLAVLYDDRAVRVLSNDGTIPETLCLNNLNGATQTKR